MKGLTLLGKFYRIEVITMTAIFVMFFLKTNAVAVQEDRSPTQKPEQGDYQEQTEICHVTFTPDLPLIESNELIEADIDAIVGKYQDEYLGNTAPTPGDLSSAIESYNSLNIEVINGVISGKSISNTYKDIRFLKTLANHLRHFPEDTVIREKANNTVWLVTDQICKGTLSGNLYSFDDFSRPAALLSRSFNDTLRDLFEYALDAYNGFDHLWVAVYDENYMKANDGISTDHIYILGESLMVFAANQQTADERYLWMRGYKRWVERFTTFSPGTANGIKPDGTGFHHWTAYDNYMYAFKNTSKIIYYLSGSSFQVNRENYLRFRDAVYAQIVYSNDSRLKPLSMSGRKPHSRDSQYSQSTLKQLALAGGYILNLQTADTVLAAEYNRLFGPDPEFNYTTVASLSSTSGFFQFNYANLGIFRKDGWVAGMKGFTSGLWGSELYATSNRYGRYQSYGTLEIVYPGNEYSGNGFNVSTWNWNYNPGATTIVLPWNKLHGEYARIDEYQQKNFCGALAFKNKNSIALNGIHGTVGVFAMDFQEEENLGFSTNYGPNTHNKTFRWKKSTWAFDDMIIALGSNINTSQASGPGATTLFQRMDNNSNEIIVNGAVQDQSLNINGNENNWLINNYSTGFYVVNGNDETVLWNGQQQVPYHDQIDPSEYVNNITTSYWIGYINHGTDPVDAEYEYMAIPNATNETMIMLDNKVKSDQKPYRVIQKDSDAHIILHSNGIWGYAIFNSEVDYEFKGSLREVSDPCMIMYEANDSMSGLRMALSVPDLGIGRRSYEPVLSRTIHITLGGEFVLADPGQSSIDGISSANGKTNITITTREGLPVEFELIGDVIHTNVTENQVNRDPGIRLYPNPADHVTWIEGDFPGGSKWQLYNCLGSLINEGNLSSYRNEIDISGLAPGVYIVNAIFKRGILYTGKLLVK